MPREPDDLFDLAIDLEREMEASGQVLLLSGPIDVARGIFVEVRLIGRSVCREDVELIQEYLFVLAAALPAAPEAGA
jgi:hypothetical protein